MEIEALFTEQKWKILQSLSQESFSPMQLAQRSKTSMSNISQQLRLLEFSNLVKKAKVPNRDKGKPRTLFSLSNNFAYIISVTDGFAEKKLVKLDELHNILIKTLYLDPDIHYHVEKFVWQIEQHLANVGLLMLHRNGNEIDVTVVSSGPKELKIKDMVIENHKGISVNFKVKVISGSEAEKQVKKGVFSELGNLLLLYDPHRMVSKAMGDIKG